MGVNKIKLDFLFDENTHNFLVFELKKKEVLQQQQAKKQNRKMKSDFNLKYLVIVIILLKLCGG